MSETTATHDCYEVTYGGFEEVREIPIGWLCPRCGAVNAPDVKRCDCEPRQDDMRHGVLPNTVVGPSETK